MSLFERNAVPSNYGLVESPPGFGAVPFDKFANGVILGALRTQGGGLFGTADFDCPISGSRKTVFAVRLRLFSPISAVCTIGRCGIPVTRVCGMLRRLAFLIPAARLYKPFSEWRVIQADRSWSFP